MKIKYLSFTQAKAISGDHQYLIGYPFESHPDNTESIRQVLVAPYSRILQWQFLRDLLRGMPHSEALQICPNGRYDVLVLPEKLAYSALSYRTKRLRDYLQEHRLEFRPELYSCLRSV